MTVLYAVALLVLLQRVGELAFAAANTRRLRALGAVELDAAGYLCFIVMHGSWLACLLLGIGAETAPSWPLLGLYALLQVGRLWVMLSLGRSWTTRIMIRPGAPLVETGPYRHLRHPNYVIVAGEIALLPLAFGAVVVAIVFSALNLVLLARRIGLEGRALRRCAVT
jgi:methyltransferase